MRTRGLGLVILILGLLALAVDGCWPPGALVYNAPVTYSIAAGEEVPGTDIRYVGKTEKGAELIIEGQKAYKKTADSVDWQGTLTRDVTLDLTTRVVRFTEEMLQVAGTAKVTVNNPAPQAASVPSEAPLEYHTIPVASFVGKGKRLPGTLIEYIGPTDKGAELGGVEGYPYRKTLDSIVWEGQLKEDVFLKLDVRVVRYDERGLVVTGLASLWITP
ncbi:MAG: hypothetical protein ACE5MB_07340 [Anaerolineae bacterium]